jgi:two-component system chemotaxis response regulator CheY
MKGPYSDYRVLIVEDARPVVRVLKMMFEDAGFIVSVAHDGVQAMTKIAENKIDVLITDINMPNMDGQTLCEELSSSGPYLPKCVFVVTSTMGNLQRSWFDKHPEISLVEKPVGPRHLLRLVIRHLEVDGWKERAEDSDDNRRVA